MLRRYRAAGIDPLAEPIFTYPVLHYQNGGLVIDTEGETTLEGLFACGEIAGGTHGRNRMMGNSLLECCVFGRRAGQGRSGKEQQLSTTIDTDLYGAVEDAAAHLYVWALKDIPQDLRDALADAAGRETSVPGQRVLNDDPQERPGRRRREEPRLPGHRHRRLHLPRRRALPAPPGADLRGAEGGHRARDDRAPAALERGAHDHAREHRPEHRLPPADRPLGVHPGLGRPRRQVRPEGLGLRRT